MYYCYFNCMLGKLLLTGNELLENIYFPSENKIVEYEKEWKYSKEKFKDVLLQLDAYFKKELTVFDLDFNAKGSDFQKQVWKELVKIPYGETAAYSEIAKRVGNPKASRAIGMANNRNPIPIIIPCHRVIGKDGSLTGFGGGLDIKKKLLELEKKAFDS